MYFQKTSRHSMGTIAQRCKSIPHYTLLITLLDFTLEIFFRLHFRTVWTMWKDTRLDKSLSWRAELNKVVSGDKEAEEVWKRWSSEVISFKLEGVVVICLGEVSRLAKFVLEALDLMPAPETQMTGSILISMMMPPVSLTRKLRITFAIFNEVLASLECITGADLFPLIRIIRRQTTMGTAINA